MLTNAVVDISHWDEIRSFTDTAASGVVGIISKATEGASYVDPTYATRRPQAEAAGLKWGAYHFLRPGDMKAQAKFFVDTVGLDCELMAADHEDEGVSLEDLKLWLQTVTDLTGKRPILYSGHVLKEQIGSGRDDELAQYRLWLAQYTSGSPSWPTATWPIWWLWQYTESGTCAGIYTDGGDVDLNKYDGKADELRADWSGTAAPSDGTTVTVTITAPAGSTVQVAQS